MVLTVVDGEKKGNVLIIVKMGTCAKFLNIEERGREKGRGLERERGAREQVREKK